MATTNGFKQEKEKHKFILFVSGMSVKSIKAIENIDKICNQYMPGNFEIEIIDVSKNPHQAVHYQIVGLPTLIKTDPLPSRIILGDLSETSKVLEILNIEPC